MQTLKAIAPKMTADDLKQFEDLFQEHSGFPEPHAASAEHSFLAALKMLGDRDLSRRAEALAELGVVYTDEDKLLEAEQVYRQSFTVTRSCGPIAEIYCSREHLTRSRSAQLSPRSRILYFPYCDYWRLSPRLYRSGFAFESVSASAPPT
jgi:hypothetical protein